ncbi:MAG TPA: protein kinase [Candidatus Angelobacter sp.]
MTPERWVQIKDIFASVVELPPEARRAGIAGLCQGDAELEVEVERLLSQHDDMGGFLEGSSPASSKSTDEIFSPGNVLAGRYRILEPLGSGGMGEVYAAEDQDLGEPVAIKVIRPQTPFGPGLLDRLRREVQLARRVTHPNVCRVFDLGHHQQANQEFIFLTMELIRGETLSNRLKREGRIAPTEALLIAEQLCQGLEAAHRASILHRDFKCSNVMLIGSGDQVRAVVTDFGIARLIRPPDESQSLTTTHGMVAGTPAYMSPEQLLGEDLTAASDIYSLGLVLYEMVTGSRPFRDESSWTETLKRLTNVPPAPVKVAPELNQRWNSTILRCLARDPAKRFSSVREVAESLKRRRGASPRLPLRFVVLAGACAVVLVVVAGFLLRDRIWTPKLPAQKHIAVLPFTFVGTDPANQAAAYELSESLTGNLSRLQASESSLWVVPWQEVRNQKPGDEAHASSSLGVNLLLTGELQKNAGTLRLLMELKDSKSLKPLRSGTVAIPGSQIATLEDKLFEQASSMLQLHVPPETLHNLPVGATTEPGAYEFYEQGRGYLLRSSPAALDDLDRAIALLQKAIDKDANFALAYANLASAYARKFRQTNDVQWLNKAKPMCQRALSLNENLAPAHVALGRIQEATGDREGAIREFEKALQLDPTDDATMTALSRAYDSAGRFLQAEALLKDAVRRSGISVNYAYLGKFYWDHADYAQAESAFHNAIELAPDNPLSYYSLGGVYLAEGKYKEAEDILTRGIVIRPTAGAYANLALARQYQGHYDEAAAMFQKAIELRPDDHRNWLNLAVAYHLAGNRPKAVAAFQNALQLTQKIAARSPKDSGILGWQARYYAELGEKAKAEQVLASALTLSHNEPELLFNSAVVYELARERDRALAALRSALLAGYSFSEVQNAPEFDQLRQDKRYSRINGN